MNTSPLTDSDRDALAEQRASLCMKYSKLFWDAHNGHELPNLALIINDAITEGIEQYVKAIKK